MNTYSTHETWQGGGGTAGAAASEPSTESGGATQMCQATARAVGDMVARHPASSTLLVTAAGFALGAVLGACLARPAKKQSAMARFGQSVWDSMAKVVPDSWTK